MVFNGGFETHRILRGGFETHGILWRFLNP